jgi:crotonobetainyl-CoA:carnitine CoA-transferase CaiB-like acyl-CoA transferase
VFDALVRDADVYIQNFRPGAAERLGAGESRLRELNPRLIYCAISGFGQTGRKFWM